MPNAKIMIVEDEMILAMDIKECVERLGHQVCTIASTGEEAVVKAGEVKPDLIFMDILLKGEMDGIVAAEQIRSKFGTPIIFLTAFGEEATLARAKVTEPYGYILKPFEEKNIQVALEIALYKRMMEAERDRLNQELMAAQKQIKVLIGILPICSYCKKIRDDGNTWRQLEDYISKHSEALFSHGICPDCEQKLQEELANLRS